MSRYKKKQTQSSDQSLPQYLSNYQRQWSSIQKRLDFVETTIAKMQKRNQKIEKRFEQQSNEMIIFKKQIKRLAEQSVPNQNQELSLREKELEIENMKIELEELHSYIKRVEKKNNEMFKELKNTTIAKYSEELIQERIEERLKEYSNKNYQVNKQYIDRAVTGLKNIVKDQVERPELNKNSSATIFKSNSKSRINFQESSEKSHRGSYTDIAQNNTSFDDKKSVKSPARVTANAVGNSRVSYLRQKLKQFQEINKKYQQKPQKKGYQKSEEKKTVQKLKEFKNYLEQSQSEIDQSNIQIENNVLTDSLKKWKNGDKYRSD